MAADPSQNVHQDLLPHIHLISTYRYATTPRVELPEVTKWLLAAPKIARDTAPFFWTYLEAPPDGTIVLAWQPTNRRGTEFASDGYIWAGGETFYQQEVGNGLILEIYYQRAGYRPPTDQFAMHSRRRFRLLPPKGPSPNTPQVDPNLWIVHYGPVENNERIPINMIPFNSLMQQMINTRAQVQRAGQIARKEFMLSDRVNWPQIPLPREGRGQPMFAPPPNARGVPQQMAYPPHGPAHPPHHGKRARHAAAQAQPQGMIGSSPAAIDSIYDDEEDVSRGDMFDHLSPREVSIARYQQNHEWMEEVVSSAYRMGQIIHADLGLGLKGELAPMTEGVFNAPGGDVLRAPSRDDAKKTYIGHLDKDLADEFRKRANEKIESTKAEIEKMKAEHAKMLAQFKANSIIKHAEQELRMSVQQTGGEFWRLEGWAEDGEDAGRRGQRHNKSVEEIVSGVESVVDRKVEVVHDVRRVQDGGYQEPEPEPEPVAQPVITAPEESAGPSASMSRQPSHAGSQNSGIMVGDSDIDMGGTAAGLLDQMHTGFSAGSTPMNNFPTPQPQSSAMHSNAATPANIGAPSPQPANPPAEQTATKSEDVSMSNAGAAQEGPATTTTAPDQGTGSGDWVVVPKGGVSPVPSPNAGSAPPAGNTPAPATTLAAETKPTPTPISKPSSAVPTPAGGGDADSMSFDNNDFSSLGDLDTAGEALAGYDPPTIGATSADLGEGMDINMDMEDSAFGDAFHGVGSGDGGADMS